MVKLGSNPIASTSKVGTVAFKCPQCLKGKILRSPLQRKLAVKYHCQECGFEGPN